MNELDLLIENYFTESFEASDLFRLVEQVMLSEAGLPASQIKKYPERIELFITKIETPEEPFTLTDGSTVFLPADKNEELLSQLRDALENPALLSGTLYAITANGNRISTGKLAKSNVYTASKKLRISNKGDVVEGLLGVAMFISLRDGVVTEQRIIDTLKALDEQKETSSSKKKISSALESLSSAKKAPKGVLVKLKVALNIGNFKDLVSEEKRGLLKSEYANVLRYSKSDRFRNFRDTVIFDRANPPQNSVTIGVIGAEEQTESKADLKLFKDDELIFSHSLKYGSRQLGQVGGRDVEKVFAWLNKIFDTQLPQYVKDQYRDVLASECDDKFKERLYRATSAMFAVIYKDAKGKLNSNNYQEELLKALKASSIGKESSIDLLNFEKNKFRLLDFEQIEKLSDYLNLDIDFRPSPDVIPDKGGYPMLTVFDPRQSVIPNKESTLFTVRPKYEANKCYPRFYLEYGDLVDNILTKVNENKLKE